MVLVDLLHIAALISSRSEISELLMSFGGARNPSQSSENKTHIASSDETRIKSGRHRSVLYLALYVSLQEECLHFRELSSIKTLLANSGRPVMVLSGEK